MTVVAIYLGGTLPISRVIGRRRRRVTTDCPVSDLVGGPTGPVTGGMMPPSAMPPFLCVLGIALGILADLWFLCIGIVLTFLSCLLQALVLASFSDLSSSCCSFASPLTLPPPAAFAFVCAFDGVFVLASVEHLFALLAVLFLHAGLDLLTLGG